MDKKSKITENFNDDYNRSLMTQTEYELSELTNQRDFYNEYVDDKLALDKWYDSEKKQIMDNRASSEKTAVEGIKDSFKEYVKESQDTYTQVNHMFTNGLYGMEDALVDFITTGKASFSDFINSIAADFVRMMVKMNITSPLAQAASSVNWGSMLSGFAFANGGIMSSQGAVPLRAYSSGGIANSPQLALYGEGRMNEAYVPLPDGKTIPVTMSGSNGGATTLILNIENNSGQAIDAKQISQMTSTDSEGRKTEVLSIVIDAYNRNLMQLRDTLKGGR
jgi:lambda family phage tail tape measure protein